MTEILSLDTSVHLEFHNYRGRIIEVGENENKEDLNLNISSQYNIS